MAQTIPSSIVDFYADRSVFITGASGFVGKALVEKLLRSCTRIKTVYILLRPKNGQEVKQRLEQLLRAKVFDRVRKEQPGCLSKIIAIQGCLMLPGLGISPSDQLLLATSVSVVFHSAATVKFNEQLNHAVEMNVCGTRRLLELCQKMEQLEALVHVSTAYCNGDREQVDEVVYKPPAPPQRIIDITEWMNEEQIDLVTPHLIKGHENTYTFTKALAESLLVDESGALPVAVVRPSIVTAAWKEPFAGWIDNLSGATGPIVAIGKGLLRSMYCNKSFKADFIPVDTVINLIIAVAWYTASHRPNGIQVYNCTPRSCNRITWGDLEQMLVRFSRTYPSREVFFYPDVRFVNSKLLHSLSTLLFHDVPARFVDTVAFLAGRPRRLVPIYEKLHRTIEVIEYFTTHEFAYSHSNVINLLKKLSPQDRQEFNFDVQNLDWNNYFETYILGIRRFLLKEEISSLPASRKNLRRIYFYTKAGQALLMLLLWRIVFMQSTVAQDIWLMFRSAATKLFQLLLQPILNSGLVLGILEVEKKYNLEGL